VRPQKVDAFRAVVGRGAAASLDGERDVLGKAGLMQEDNVAVADAERAAERLREARATAVFVARNGHLLGAIAVTAPVKPTTPAAIAALRDSGLRIAMLTGDNEVTARAVAAQLGIDEIRAGVSPAAKADWVA